MEIKNIIHADIVKAFNLLETETVVNEKDLVKNSFKNDRYVNIKPFSFNNNVGIGDDYINASEIKLEYFDHTFLTTQHPLESSFYQFWKMIGENKIKIIVMLNTFDEDHLSYFPQMTGKSLSFNDFTVTLESSIIEDVLKRTVLNVEYRGNKWTVLHLQMISWIDLKAPKIADLRQLISSFYHVISKMKNEEKIVLHCSAGVGRSGVFLTCLEMERYFLKNESVEKFSVDECIKVLRKQRMNMVNTIEQYAFLKEYHKKFLKFVFCSSSSSFSS